MPLAIFIGTRLLSFLTRNEPIVQSIIAAAILLLFIILFFKNNTWAWYALIGEMLLGGNGHFFELFGLALRTWIVYIFLLLWFVEILRERSWKERLYLQRPLAIILGLLGFSVFLGMVFGTVHSHDMRVVIQDAIHYSFL